MDLNQLSHPSTREKHNQIPWVRFIAKRTRKSQIHLVNGQNFINHDFQNN